MSGSGNSTFQAARNTIMISYLRELSTGGKGSLNPVLMDLGSVSKARVEIRSRKEALAAEDEAATKSSAPFRAPELTQVPSQITLDERVDIW